MSYYILIRNFVDCIIYYKMAGEDMCEYLFNHLGRMTQALSLQSADGSTLDAEGFMPSKRRLTSDFNNANNSSQPAGNYGMVCFVLFVFMAYMVLSFLGASSRPSEKVGRPGIERNFGRDNEGSAQ